MRNIILLATYWNEMEWITESLNQILKIDPIEIIICDGNFDPTHEINSTDGTKEIIENFVKDNSSRARLINPVRVNPLTKGYHLFRGTSCNTDQRKTLGRLLYSLKSQLRMNIYRVNQALTFAKMARLSSRWKPGTWVMTSDADQFYTDDLIDSFDLTNKSDSDIQLITADEYTFPYDFENYTQSYEKRTWNNMPHKIGENLAFYPTRHLVHESKYSYKHLHQISNHYHAGVYHHYKFRLNTARLDQGYTLGDRRPPEENRYQNLRSAKGIAFPEVMSTKITSSNQND